MNSPNPYAPPTAEVADIEGSLEASPPLWNPGAASSWSLILTPIFGSLIHMKNWDALGEPAKAAQSKAWAIGCAVFILAMSVLGVLLPAYKGIDGLTRALGIALLVTWYYSSGKPQQAYVTAKFGTTYPRRGWGKPMLYALLGFVGLVVAMIVVGVILGLVVGPA